MKHFFLVVVFVANIINAQSINDEISNDIKSKILINLSKIPVGSEKLYGFDSREDFKNCTIGTPIKIVLLNDNNILIEQEQWRIPVKLNGNNKTLFTVQKIDDTYEIVDIGGNDLSKELQVIESKNSSVNYFLRLYNPKIDFVSNALNLKDLANVRFFLMESAQLFLEAKQKNRVTTTITISELLNLIK